MKRRVPIFEILVAIVFTVLFAVAGYFVTQDSYDGLSVSDSEFRVRLKCFRKDHFGRDANSYDNMAKKLGITPDILKAIENGQKPVNFDFRTRLIDTFENDTDFLLGKRRAISSISFYIWVFFGLIIGLLIPRLLLPHDMSKLNKSLDSLLRQKLELTLKDVLGERIFNNVRASHVALLNGYILGAVNEIMANGKAGIRFFSRMSPGEYATLSTNLDKVVRSEQACNLFTPGELVNNPEVLNHLTVANKRAAKGELTVVRIQIVTQASYSDFVSPTDQDVLKRYNDIYRKAPGIKFFWAFDSEIAVSYVVQDYLLYDERLVLVYDTLSQRLELDVGGIVDEYKTIFQSTGLRSSADFEQLLNGTVNYPV